MKHSTEERASKRSSQEDGGGTSSTGVVSQLDNWSWPAVQGANSNQANKWVQTKCEKTVKKKWIAEKNVKKVPNNFKLRAGLASWLASQASWEWPSSMPIENRIFFVFFSLSTYKRQEEGIFLCPSTIIFWGMRLDYWLKFVVRWALCVAYTSCLTLAQTHTHTDPKQHTWSVMLWLNLIELSIRLMCPIWLSDKARKYLTADIIWSMLGFICPATRKNYYAYYYYVGVKA